MCTEKKITRNGHQHLCNKRLLSTFCYFLGFSDIRGHHSLTKHRPSQHPTWVRSSPLPTQGGQEVREDKNRDEGVSCSLGDGPEKFGQLTNLRWELRSQSTSPHSAPEDRTRDSVKNDLQVKSCKHQGKGLLITLNPKWSITFPHFSLIFPWIFLSTAIIVNWTRFSYGTWRENSPQLGRLHKI